MQVAQANRLQQLEGGRRADGAVCGRPAAPGPGRAPPVRSSRLGPPGPVGGANPQTGGPCGCRPRQDEHTRQYPGDQGGPAHPADKCALQPHGAVRRPQVFPAHPGRGQWPRVHQPGRVGTRPLFTWPGSPRKGTATSDRASTASPGDRPHRPRDLLHPPGSPGPGRGRRQTNNQLRPHSPLRYRPPHTKPPPHPHRP